MSMKDVEEYNEKDLADCIEHAEKIAMGAIEDRYHDNKDNDVVCMDTVHTVKKAMQVLQMAQEIRAHHSVKV